MSGPSDHPAAAYPAWLGRPAAQLTIVIGPSGSLSLDHANMHASPGDEIVDLAAIISNISGQLATRAGPEWIVPALQIRNDRLANLTTPAWLIVPAPVQWQRDFWRARGDTVLVDPGVEAVLIEARRTGVEERWIHRWYSEAARSATTAPARREFTGARPSERPPSSKRGYGREHRVLRDEQLAREPWCRFCWTERQVKIRATVLDHIEPFRKADGTLDGRLWGNPKNHRSLCKPCHDKRGAKHNRAEKPPGVGVDGRPLDPNHAWNRTA